MTLFVRSLAQLHISESAAIRPIARLPQAPRAQLARRDAFCTTAQARDASNPTNNEEATTTNEDVANSTKAKKQDPPASGPVDAIAQEDFAAPSTAKNTSSTRKKRVKAVKRNSPPISASPPRPPESWQSQKSALKEKFPDGWRPLKRLSPDAISGIRALHAQFPEEYTTQALARQFEVSPEAIRRILKSKWSPSADEEEDRQERWFRRGRSVWSRYAELGMKPPQKWRGEGVIRDPSWHEKRQAAIMRRKDEENRQGNGARLHQRLGRAIM